MIVAIVTTIFNLGETKRVASMRNIRLATLAVGTLGLLLALFFEDLVNLILNAFTSLAILLPATFLPLVMKVREDAAFYSIVTGLLLAGTWLVIEPSDAFVPAILATAIVFILLSVTNKKGTTLACTKDT